nr:MAG TPA: hypothetical protein [Bacteriophage sp.]
MDLKIKSFIIHSITFSYTFYYEYFHIMIILRS